MPMDNSRVARERRADVAKKNQAAHDKRTPKQQLKELDKRLGAGVGATRERAKLVAQL